MVNAWWASLFAAGRFFWVRQPAILFVDGIGTTPPKPGGLPVSSSGAGAMVSSIYNAYTETNGLKRAIIPR